MSTSEIFLVAMGIIFLIPYLIWRLGGTEYYAPLVVVQIITGILLGPGLLGAAFPSYYAFVFNPAVVQSLNGIAWWAVMSFVWIAGIELDLAGVWVHRRESGITAGLALGTPLLLGCAAGDGLKPLRRLDRRQRDRLAIRARHRHGLRGDGAADTDPVHGESCRSCASPSGSASCATPAWTMWPSGGCWR
jgi:hypothetical protein